MKQFYYRVINAIKIGFLAYKNPDIIRIENLKMADGLYDLIRKVSVENKPYMTHLSYCYPDVKTRSIVSIWAGAGHCAEPVGRIKELVSENQFLKDSVSRLLLEKESQVEN